MTAPQSPQARGSVTSFAQRGQYRGSGADSAGIRSEMLHRIQLPATGFKAKLDRPKGSGAGRLVPQKLTYFRHQLRWGERFLQECSAAVQLPNLIIRVPG